MSRFSAKSAAYRRLRDEWLLNGDHGWVCHLCGRHVPMDVPPRSPEAPTVDHLVPRSKGGAEMDTSLWRLAHFACNARRGDAEHVEPTRGATRTW
jgi:5-methylcytosine-specific restriction endonuclease McrA